jgi:hypothetical protein
MVKAVKYHENIQVVSRKGYGNVLAKEMKLSR